jgi:hypothetical protein
VLNFAIQQPSLAQPGNQLDWAAVVTFVNPTDQPQAIGFDSICPSGYMPADLSATKPAYVVTGARLTLWPGPFSPFLDKYGQYIGFIDAPLPVGVTKLTKAQIDSFLVLSR